MSHLTVWRLLCSLIVINIKSTLNNSHINISQPSWCFNSPSKQATSSCFHTYLTGVHFIFLLCWSPKRIIMAYIKSTVHFYERHLIQNGIWIFNFPPRMPMGIIGFLSWGWNIFMAFDTALNFGWAIQNLLMRADFRCLVAFILLS